MTQTINNEFLKFKFIWSRRNLSCFFNMGWNVEIMYKMVKSIFCIIYSDKLLIQNKRNYQSFVELIIIVNKEPKCKGDYNYGRVENKHNHC